jgi:hypothetical protein
MAEHEGAEVIGLVEVEIHEPEAVVVEPPSSTHEGAPDLTELPGESGAHLAERSVDLAPPLDEPVSDPIQSAASTPVTQAETTEPKPTATAHRTSRLRQSWHPPMSVPVDKDPYDTRAVYAVRCEDCEYVGPWHGREEGALEDEFDHAFPGWRELVPVVAAMDYKETQNKKAYSEWKDTIVELYPAGWVEAGGPVLVARNRGSTRWHDDWFLGGNYNVCGVERALDLHAPGRHKGRTRLVAASYQPRDIPPPHAPDGPVGQLTAQDTAAALAGIFTPGKLVGLSAGLRDTSTLKAWLKARAQESRDEHVGRRPAATSQPPTFDTVAETREGLAVVVLTETERREGLIPWAQAAQYLRPALTPESAVRLSELYEDFQRFYTDPQREIAPTLAALHALREQTAVIHQAAAAHEMEALASGQAPTAEPTIEEGDVFVAATAATTHQPEEAELLLPTSQPTESPLAETGATTWEHDEYVYGAEEPQEPDYEQLYAEEFAQDSAGQATTTPARGSLTSNTEPSLTQPTHPRIEKSAHDVLLKGDGTPFTEGSGGPAPQSASPRRQGWPARRSAVKQNLTQPGAEEDLSGVQQEQASPSRQTRLEPQAVPVPQAPTAHGKPTPQPSPPAVRRSSQPPTAKERSEMFEQAVDLALQGFAVFPLKPGTKRPMFKGWEKLASTDPRQIARWWNATPTANIGIACGPSHLLVIDLDKAKRPDGPRHGQETLAKLAAGRELPHTLAVASARGERHLYFRQPNGANLGITTGSDTSGLGPLVDTRGHSGFIVAPGSVFEGGTYRTEHEAAVAPLPAWIVDELAKHSTVVEPPTAPVPSRMPVTDRRHSAYGNAALKRSANTVATAPEGTRNDTLNRESFRLGRLIGGGVIDRNDAVPELRRAAHRAGLPPDEAANTIAPGLSAGIGHPRFIPDPAPSPPTSHPTKEAAMTTVTDQGLRSTNPTTTAPKTEQATEAVRAAQLDVVRATTTAANDHEAAETPERAEAPSAGDESSSTTDSTPTKARGAVAHEEPTTASEAEFDFDDIWSDVRASIERARQAIPDWSELNTADDLKPAIDEALRYLAQTPIPRVLGDSTDSSVTEGPTASPEPASLASQSTDTRELDAEDLDEHLAAVDAAYADARANGIARDRPEWAGITAIHSAIHNLWDTVKAAAGTYWAELSADVHVHGLLTALATRAIRAIANLANAATTHLEQRGAQQQLGAKTDPPGLREAYINARNQVHAHAATHEWQRITALWGTVNTLTRQAGDPGIRAVIARSADAISDYAEALGRKTSQYGHTGATDALAALGASAERHAATLRTGDRDQTPGLGLHQAPTAVNSPQPLGSAPPPQQGTEAQLLQARARQVAQHAQARLGQTPRRAVAAPCRAHNAGKRDQSNPMRPMRPNSPRESTNIQVR